MHATLFRFLSLRIGTRLGLAFAALLSLMLVLAALSAMRLGQLAASHERLAGEQLQISESVDKARRNADLAVRKLLVLIGLKRDARVQAYAEIDAANGRLDSTLDGLKGREVGGDGGATVRAIQQQLEVYRQAYIDTADLIEADDIAAAREVLGSRTEVALNGLTEALDTLVRRHHGATVQESAAITAQIRQDRQTLWALCGGALLL